MPWGCVISTFVQGLSPTRDFIQRLYMIILQSFTKLRRTLTSSYLPWLQFLYWKKLYYKYKLGQCTERATTLSTELWPEMERGEATLETITVPLVQWVQTCIFGERKQANQVVQLGWFFPIIICFFRPFRAIRRHSDSKPAQYTSTVFSQFWVIAPAQEHLLVPAIHFFLPTYSPS